MKYFFVATHLQFADDLNLFTHYEIFLLRIREELCLINFVFIERRRYIVFYFGTFCFLMQIKLYLNFWRKTKEKISK